MARAGLGIVAVCLAFVLEVPFAIGFLSGQALPLSTKLHSRVSTHRHSHVWVSQFQMPKFEMPSFGGFGGQGLGAVKLAMPSRVLPGLKGKLLVACDASQKGVRGTGDMPKEEFDALVEEIVSLNPTTDPAVR